MTDRCRPAREKARHAHALHVEHDIFDATIAGQGEARLTIFDLPIHFAPRIAFPDAHLAFTDDLQRNLAEVPGADFGQQMLALPRPAIRLGVDDGLVQRDREASREPADLGLRRGQHPAKLAMLVGPARDPVFDGVSRQEPVCGVTGRRDRNASGDRSRQMNRTHGPSSIPKWALPARSFLQ